MAPHLLSDELRARVVRAKALAAQRQAIEAELPKHLLFTSGWPTARPTIEEAELLASVRRRISSLLDFPAKYLTANAVLEQYDQLLAERAAIA